MQLHSISITHLLLYSKIYQILVKTKCGVKLKRLLSVLGAEIYQSLRIGMAKEDLAKFNNSDIVICDFKLADKVLSRLRFLR